MTIRRKLLLFIPLLVLLVNGVTFFVFQSGKIVQQSYGTMMNRILLYKQCTDQADSALQALYRYLLNPQEERKQAYEDAEAALVRARDSIAESSSASPHASALISYTNMLDTLLQEAQESFQAAGTQETGTALTHYNEAEQTTGFIREEGQRLVNVELAFYQPVYERIQQENERLNRLGAAVFIINSLMSVVLAIWISRSITGPVGQLASMARGISKGWLDIDPPPLQTRDELGLLAAAFRQMLADLKELIARDKASLEKDRLVKELELQALQSQINPHFLFNSLNVLSKLALLEGADKTSDLIISMSNLLRYNLRKLDQPVTLRDELGHIKEYFTIQQARFRDRVRFETDIDPDALETLLPALTIQPLVENAFVHGIEGMEQGAFIRIAVRHTQDYVKISVSDNGRGMSPETRQALLRMDDLSRLGNREGAGRKPSTGLGTRNVFKRIQLFYEGRASIGVYSEPGQGTTVEIRIPGSNSIPQAQEAD